VIQRRKKSKDMKNNLQKLTDKSKKRLGRGYGSGKGGHTSSRGQKGQKARRSIGILFEGMKMKKSLIKRLPIKRGKLKQSAGVKPFAISLDTLLNFYKKNEVVSEKTLLEKGIVTENLLKKRGVKIVGSSKKNITHELKFEVKTSKVLSSQETQNKSENNTKKGKK
jgi:large subunit ribosomal protein L15